MRCRHEESIVALNKPTSGVRARFNQAVQDGILVALSSIVLFELWYGVAKSQQQQRNASTLGSFLAGPIRVLNFEAEDAREAGEIRAELERLGTPIGPHDLLIAGQARRHRALLVTANVGEFSRVPGLKTEDWAIA